MVLFVVWYAIFHSFLIALAIRAQTRGSGPGDDPALMDVAAMTRSYQLATAIRITADNVRAPPDLSGKQYFIS